MLLRRINDCFFEKGSPLLISKEKGMGDEVDPQILTLNPYRFAVQVLLLNNKDV
jgi:hypothetical protein